MSRLIRNQEKFWGKGNYKGEKYIIGSDGVTSKQMCLNKLGKLEDLEEELGCPLEVMVKAIKNGIWFINTKNELEYIDEALSFNTKRDSGKFVFDNYGYYCKNIEKIKCNEIYLEDYKKTWWLKKDKSE